MMEKSHNLTLYVSYYLSRFNNEGLANLGYTTWNDAYEDISRRLVVKHHTVRNYRDEFDPFIGNRKGWYQRPLRPSCVQIYQALENLDEIQILDLVTDILSEKLNNNFEEEQQLLSIVTKERNSSKREYIIRMPTGRAAEEFFIKQYEIMSKPLLK